ncbi:phenylalanine--tRNA ligase subunit alpha [Sulfolobales archaeon HS-7]|nr:phenylalanine--tRNA ligase subunit alpha [Sulfolobales archaeon HS-7]
MLSESERKVLAFLSQRQRASIEEIAEGTGIDKNGVNSIVELLHSKGLIDISTTDKVRYELTEEGKERLERGLPEERLVQMGEVDMEVARKELGKDFDIAISWGKRKGMIQISQGKIIVVSSSNPSNEREELGRILNDPNYLPSDERTLLSRGLIRRKVEKEKKVSITEKGVEILKELMEKKVITNLTHEVILNGLENYVLREKNVEAEPPKFLLGKKHFFREFLNEIREVMLSLGFNEVYTGYIESEFYNFDVLFQPQDHPAREIHDSFTISGSAKVDPKLVEIVRDSHETMWRYKWSEAIASRLVLRSQATATTARTLASGIKLPARYFTIGKVFRPDAIDATHLLEFHQLDGFIVEKDFNFRKLLSLLKEIFNMIGIREVRFKPGYFPFTEPSVEIYGYISGIGWTEMAGAGLLRPEVIRISGLDEVGGAWGIGLDRIALTRFGLKDIRLLYTRDVEFLRNMTVRI